MKLFRSAIAGLVAALLCLGCAQSQALSAAREAPADLLLYTLDCGRLDVRDLDVYSEGALAGVARTMANPCFLIRHPDGDLLWETGLPESLAAMPQGADFGIYHFRMARALTAQLADIGLSPNDIEYVSLSHGHIDHYGNTGLFAHATLLLDAREYDFILDPNTQRISAEIAGYAPEEVAQTHRVLAAMPVERLSGDQPHDVFGDGRVVIHPFPGHTPGHQTLMVRLEAAGPVFLAGDIYHLAETRARRFVALGSEPIMTRRSMEAVERLMQETGARLVRQHVAEDVDALPRPPAALH